MGIENMIIYNVTIQVSKEIREPWLAWMLDIQVPGILGTGCFEKHQVLRLLDTGETEVYTYAFQYFASSKAMYNLYMERYKTALTQQSFDAWGDQFISFSTLMEVIN